MISLIAAMDENRLIGKNNDLPWRLPADLAYFKKVTMGRTVVMGRKTFESIGKPLPGRENVIVTSRQDYKAEGAAVVHSLDELLAFDNHSKELFIIGGARLYEQTLPHANRLYLTEIQEQFEGDTYFPVFNQSEWNVIFKEQGVKDEKNSYTYFFTIYER
ncbi:type 3 dihydrofolate reductase [Bacillus songklensis]|uniref:Dihydrofolate reductase n=1 Tax=Bacillus songklensis TaxID=1069116 RepID=A0ABV8B4H9_9BACI